MKVRFWLLILILASMVLAACQGSPAPMPTEAPVETTDQAPSPTDPVAYPEPEQAATQPPAAPTAKPTAPVPSGSALYPNITDGSDVQWVQVQAMALNGEIAKIIVFQSTEVTVMLKDGRSLRSIVNLVSDAQSLVVSCGAPCQDIVVENQ